MKRKEKGQEILMVNEMGVCIGHPHKKREEEK